MATRTRTHKKPEPAPAKRKPGRPKGSVAPLTADYNKARAEKTAWQAQLAEQEYRKNAAELLDRARVEQAAATVLAAVAQTLRSVPDNLEAAAGLTPAQAEECERIIDSLSAGLSDKLRELGGW